MKVTSGFEDNSPIYGILVGSNTVIKLEEHGPDMLFAVTIGLGGQSSSDITYRMRLNTHEARELAALLLERVEQSERKSRGKAA